MTLTPSDPGAGVLTTYYTTDGSTPDTNSPQGNSIPLSADGVYTVKYFSVDQVGNAEAVQTGASQIRIDATNPTSSTLDALPAAIRNGQVLSGSAADATSGVATVAYYRCAGTSCSPSTLVGSSSTGPSYSVTWNSQPADGDYQVLARATDAAGNTLDSAKQTIKVDNSDPTGSLTSPAGGASLSGTISVASSSADSVSGVTQVAFQRSPVGAGTWTTIDTDSSAPYAVDWVTGGVTDGDYDLRAVTTDAAGNSFTSGSVTVTVDNTAPSASVADPGTPLRGTVSLTGSGSDPGGSGVASLTFQRSPAGAGTWTTVGMDTSSPYSVSFDTTAVADGLYDLRAVATDNAGNTTLSTIVANRRVDNTAPSASLDDPGANLRGTVTLTSTASDAGSGIASRVYAYSPAGAGTWSSTPAAFDTTAVSDGLYDLRVTVTDVAGNQTTSATVANRRVDNTAPSASLDDPGANLRGTVTLSSTASDGGSGIATRVYQHSPAGAGTWTTTPAAFDTTAVTDGLYDLRVIVTDVAGNQTTSATVANRRVDNTAPAASLDDPGANLSGTVTLTSTASDAGSGIATRTYAYSPAGAGHLDDDPGRLRHHRRHRRALRPARHRHRQRRQPNHLRHSRQPPRRQHGPDRLRHRARRSQRRQRSDRGLVRLRRCGIGCSASRLPALARRRGDVDDDRHRYERSVLGRLGDGGPRRRQLRLARRHRRRRREHTDLRDGERPGRQQRAERLDHRPGCLRERGRTRSVHGHRHDA